MLKRIKSFDPRLLITDHFDQLINQIDVETEILIAIEQQNFLNKRNVDKGVKYQQMETENTIKINKIRRDQIEVLKEIEQLNLNRLPTTLDEFYINKWSRIIDDSTKCFESKIEIIKEGIISYDCILLDKPKLIVVPFFLNDKNLNFFK